MDPFGSLAWQPCPDAERALAEGNRPAGVQQYCGKRSPAGWTKFAPPSINPLHRPIGQETGARAARRTVGADATGAEAGLAYLLGRRRERGRDRHQQEHCGKNPHRPPAGTSAAGERLATRLISSAVKTVRWARSSLATAISFGTSPSKLRV